MLTGHYHILKLILNLFPIGLNLFPIGLDLIQIGLGCVNFSHKFKFENVIFAINFNKSVFFQLIRTLIDKYILVTI